MMAGKSVFQLAAVFGLCFQTAYAVEIESWQNADGSTVSLVSRHELPIVNIQVSFKGAGSAFEQKSDVAVATAALLATGTQQADEESLRDESNRLGISIGSAAGPENAAVTLTSLSRPKTLQAALTLMQQIITAPRFDEKVLQRETAQSISALRQQEKSPGFLGSRALTKLNYEGHPYAKGAQSSEQSLSAVTRDDLLDFYRRRYAKDNAHIAIVGDVTKQQAANIGRRLLDGLPAHVQPLPELPPVAKRAGRGERIRFEGKEQTVVMMGVPLLRYNDPDRYALSVGNYIIGGGGFDSRLMKTLRDEKGLVYGVSSDLSPFTQAGPFSVQFSTQNSKAAEALTAAQNVLAEFVANGPTEAELQQAKDYLTGSFPLRFDTNAKLLPYVVGVRLNNLPADYLDRYPEEIAKVTAAQVREVWQRRLKAGELNVVVVGGTGVKSVPAKGRKAEAGKRKAKR